MKTSKVVLHIGSAFILLVLVLALSGSATAAYLAAPANGGVISGTVSSPGGYPLPAGTLVKLFDVGTEIVRGMATPDLDDGEFHIGPVRNGLYVLKAVPPEESGYTQSLPRAVSVVNAPVNVGILTLTEPQVIGTVSAPDGVTPVEAEILVYLGDGQVFQHVDAPEGTFAIGGLPVGGYGLQAFPAGDDPYWKSELTSVTIYHPEDLITVDLLLREANLWGYIQDDQGNPVPGSKISATDQSGEPTVDMSNGHGYWAIGGLSSGTYVLSALPPWTQSGLLPPEPIELVLPGAENPYTLAFRSPPKHAEGMVITNTGLPVFHAQVIARRVNLPGHAQALSEADGTYHLRLSPGLWALTIRPIEDTMPADWVYPQPPQFVFFHHSNEPETRQQDFTVVISDATVIGVVQMPDGSPPPFTVTVSLRNDEGVGLHTQIDPEDGSFELSLPNGGYKVVVHPDDPGYLGSVVEPILVLPESTYDLGSLTLLPRDAVITGVITSNGSTVSGIPVIAWRPGVPGSVKTASELEGQYALAVAEGLWHIQPAPMPDQPYLYTGSGEEIEIEAGGLIQDVDFDLVATDATISGVLVDEGGVPVSEAHGWATAFQVGAPEVHNGAPIESGAFVIHVPAGTYNLAAHLPAGSLYTSAGERRVTVLPGGSVDITLTVQVKDASIAGGLWDPRNQDVVEGVDGLVGACSGENWAIAPIDAGNGTYRMDVEAGLWHLNFRIDPAANYVKITGPVNVPVVSEKTSVIPLGIVPKDSMISGVVLAPDSSPLPGATVLVKGIGPQIDNLWLQTQSDQDGAFDLEVPHGHYRLGATMNAPDWIKPAERMVYLPPGGVSLDHVLQFREPDVNISGTLTITDTTIDGDVHVWAWSEDGGFTRGAFPVTLSGSNASGPYLLGAISNATWHLGAVFESGSQYWLGKVQVAIEETDVIQDIILKGPYPKPAPVVVTFDATEPQHISLADGTHIFIPGGAMPVEGLLTLRIVPIATLPYQQHASIYRYGYAFLATDASGQPIEEHFNQDVLITFSYDEAELNRLHIPELWLKPAYYSTTTERWTFPESYIVDAQANRVVMQIDHFTDYALTSPPGCMIYMPISVK